MKTLLFRLLRGLVPVLVLLLLTGYTLRLVRVLPAKTSRAMPADVQPDWVRNAVVYEVFVRNFTPEGTFRAMIPRLPELKALGVTTLWLMPIHPIGEERKKGEIGSPYAVQDYYDVNPRFGTKEDFRALVDAVHEEGMYLIIDLVANHSAWDNPWVEAHPDWYTRDSTGAITHPPGTDWTDVADFNYDADGLRAEMKQVMTYWVEEFGIDGYRCDVAGEVPFDFWEEAIAEVREIKPVMMLAEAYESELYEHGFDLTYGWDTYGALKKMWDGAPASGFVATLDSLEGAAPEDALRLHFTTNHDETAWDAPPVELFGGDQGSQAAFVLMSTIPGVPLVYNGQEVGTDETIGLFDKTRMDFSQNPEMRAFYENLLGLYNESEALRSGDFEVLTPDAENALLYTRSADGERLLVAVNVRDRRVTVPMPEEMAGARFADVLSGEAMTVGQELDLPAYGYRILRRQES